MTFKWIFKEHSIRWNLKLERIMQALAAIIIK